MSFLEMDVFFFVFFVGPLDCQLTEILISSERVIRELVCSLNTPVMSTCCLEQCTWLQSHHSSLQDTRCSKPLQWALHNVTCFTAPRFPITSSSMMSSSQDAEQEDHYFVCTVDMFTSVKLAMPVMKQEKILKSVCVCMCACHVLGNPPQKTHTCQMNDNNSCGL